MFNFSKGGGVFGKEENPRRDREKVYRDIKGKKVS